MNVTSWMERVQAFFKSLPRSVRRRLNQDAQRAPDKAYEVRCKIIRNLARGHRPVLIAEVLGCSYSQVFRVARRFVEDGPEGLADRREDNGEEKITEEYTSVLLEIAAQSPQEYGYDRPTWTQELFVNGMRDMTGVTISASSMCRLLKRLQIRLGMPKPIVGCPWSKRRKNRRLKKLKRLIDEAPPDEVFLYGDEVDIHLNPRIGPDYMLRGTQKSVLTPGKNQKRYLAGALNVRTGRLTWVEYDNKSSDLFIKQLWQLITTDYPHAKKIHLILDNYRIHKSKRTELALLALNGRVELHFLPPYCPDHNKIERVWRDLHANVTRNHRCKNMDQLMRQVRKYLGRRDAQLQRQYQKRRAA
jgi:transposase